MEVLQIYPSKKPMGNGKSGSEKHFLGEFMPTTA
jgi:hypothetical protein